MTTEERSPERILGYLEASVEDLKTGQQEIREDMRALREEMQAGFAQVNNQSTQVSSGVPKFYIVALDVEVGIIGSLMVVIMALLVVLILKIN